MNGATFAREWEKAWNSHDLDQILEHYCDDIIFRSRKAIPITASGEIKGKSALRAYWATALVQQPDLRFRVREVFEGHLMLTITYHNHRGVLAAETLYFNEDGKVFQAAACYRNATT